jgi:hypothetical protein
VASTLSALKKGAGPATMVEPWWRKDGNTTTENASFHERAFRPAAAPEATLRSARGSPSGGRGRGRAAAAEGSAAAAAMEGAGAPTAAFLKPAFSVQAGALLRKNLRYQQKNWCALDACALDAARGVRAPGRGGARKPSWPQASHFLGVALARRGGPFSRVAPPRGRRAAAAKPTAAWCSRPSSSLSCWAVRARGVLLAWGDAAGRLAQGVPATRRRAALRPHRHCRPSRARAPARCAAPRSGELRHQQHPAGPARLQVRLPVQGVHDAERKRHVRVCAGACGNAGVATLPSWRARAVSRDVHAWRAARTVPLASLRARTHLLTGMLYCVRLPRSHARLSPLLSSSFSSLLARPQNSHVNSDNQTVWNFPLVAPGSDEMYFWDRGQMTCSGGYESDAELCGFAYSELANRPFCANEKPVRWTPLVQVGNPAYRPASGSLRANIVDDPSFNETWQAPTSGSTRSVDSAGGTVNFSRPAPFLYTSPSSSTAQAQAQLLSNGMFYDAGATAKLTVIAADLLAQVTRAVQSRGAISMFSATQSSLLPLFAVNASGPIGDLSRAYELIPLFPLSPMLFGTAQLQQRSNLQSNPAFLGRALMYLAADCSTLPVAVRGNMSAIGTLLGATSMSCVSMPPVSAPSSDAINAALFAGYNKQQVPNGYANYPFAVDFGATAASGGFGAAAKMAPTLWYNGTLVSDSGQPFSSYFRLNAPLNRLANAFIDVALQTSTPGPRATMRYLRDMPTQGLSINLDVGTFLGCAREKKRTLSRRSPADAHMHTARSRTHARAPCLASQAALLHVAVADAAARHRGPPGVREGEEPAHDDEDPRPGRHGVHAGELHVLLPALLRLHAPHLPLRRGPGLRHQLAVDVDAQPAGRDHHLLHPLHQRADHHRLPLPSHLLQRQDRHRRLRGVPAHCGAAGQIPV